MVDIVIPEDLKISVYHEGLLLLLGYSSFDHIAEVLDSTKRANQLVEEITTFSDKQLFQKYGIENLSIGKTSGWAKFLKHLQVVSRQYGAFHPMVLGSIIEIMDQLDWQSEFNHRKFLTFFLHTPEELAHLRLAVAGTDLAYLETWREHVIEEAQGYAAYKSKIA